MRPTVAAPEPWPKFFRRHGKTFGLIALFFAAEAFLFLWLTPGPRTSRQPADLSGEQTEAWLSGHTYLKIRPSPELAKLSDPYDPRQNAPYRDIDLSYYRGKYYLYMGGGPILMLLAPWRLLTGTYLREATAVAVFDLGGSLLGLAVLVAAWRRHFPRSRGGLVAGGAFTVSLGSVALLHLDRVDWHEVAQSGATFCLAAAGATAWAALGASRHARMWLGAAGLACGLSVACRPSFVPAVILPLPICLALAAGMKSRTTSPGLRAFAACAAWPALSLAVAAAGVMLYNQARFGSPFEFGIH